MRSRLRPLRERAHAGLASLPEYHNHPPGVQRRNGIKPHSQSTFKVSHDPRFEDKLVDVVGLYMNPREHAWCSAVTRRARSRRSTVTVFETGIRPGFLFA